MYAVLTTLSQQQYPQAPVDHSGDGTVTAGLGTNNGSTQVSVV